MTRQRTPDFYDPPKVQLWAPAASLLLGLAMIYLRWSSRGTR